MEGLKMFSLENEKTKDYFFLLFQSQKEEIEGGTPKQKLKTIEVVFVLTWKTLLNIDNCVLLEKKYWN